MDEWENNFDKNELQGPTVVNSKTKDVTAMNKVSNSSFILQIGTLRRKRRNH